MTYPDTPGFQSHSETSREAAEHVNSGSQRERIVAILDQEGFSGMTADEISSKLKITNGTIAARMRELELSNAVIKTSQKRHTRSGVNAFIYVLPEFHLEAMGKAPIKEVSELEQLKRDNSDMKQCIMMLLKSLICA